MLSFSLVAEAYRPDPPSPVGVNFFLSEIIPFLIQTGMFQLDQEGVL